MLYRLSLYNWLAQRNIGTWLGLQWEPLRDRDAVMQHAVSCTMPHDFLETDRRPPITQARIKTIIADEFSFMLETDGERSQLSEPEINFLPQDFAKMGFRYCSSMYTIIDELDVSQSP